MLTWRTGCLCLAMVAAACGGSSANEIDDPANRPDAGGGIDSGGADTGGPGDSGADGTTLTCAAGTGDCDGNAANGCEVNTTGNDGHCGSCGLACTSGMSCQAGKCVAGPATVIPANTLIASNDGVCIGIDATSIYVASGRPNGDVYRVAKAGGMTTSIATLQAGPQAVTSDATSVYWASNGAGTITRANPDGTNAIPFNTGAVGTNRVAVDAQGVYWANNQLGFVGRVDQNGMNAKRIVPSAAGTLGANHIANIVAVGGFVYFSDPIGGIVGRVPNDGSAAPTNVATAVPGARGLAVFGTTVYFTTNSGGGAVLSVVPPSLTPSPVATSQGNPVSVAADAAGVYWANGGMTGAIMKRDTGAAAAAPLASGQTNPACVAVDATSVYWINQYGQAVMRVAK